jgi:hypothetical protein
MYTAASFWLTSPPCAIGLATTDTSFLVNPVDLNGLVSRHLQNTMSSIPTLMGRLIKIAGALDPRTGLYRSPEFDFLRDLDDLCALVRQEHQRMLWEWLSQPMSLRVADMSLWFWSGHDAAFAQKLLDGKGSKTFFRWVLRTATSSTF